MDYDFDLSHEIDEVTQEIERTEEFLRLLRDRLRELEQRIPDDH